MACFSNTVAEIGIEEIQKRFDGMSKTDEAAGSDEEVGGGSER